MPGTIEFEHNAVDDIYIARPKWTIETEDDCRAWYEQYERFFAGLGKKVDVIFVLDDFKVSPKMGPAWGEYRTKLINQYTRFSFRVNMERKTAVFSKTSGVRFNASSAEASTVEGAIEGVRAARARVA